MEISLSSLVPFMTWNCVSIMSPSILSHFNNINWHVKIGGRVKRCTHTQIDSWETSKTNIHFRCRKWLISHVPSNYVTFKSIYLLTIYLLDATGFFAFLVINFPLRVHTHTVPQTRCVSAGDFAITAIVLRK